MEGSIILFDFQGVEVGLQEVKASVYNLKQMGWEDFEKIGLNDGATRTQLTCGQAGNRPPLCSLAVPLLGTLVPKPQLAEGYGVAHGYSSEPC